ncbi:hypothetical protein CPB86DRAFT_218980 [Serendipita vermifera]|nr:hypothetical protein CPB86DRAFT_218980 [Serendipita vermifera]
MVTSPCAELVEVRNIFWQLTVMDDKTKVKNSLADALTQVQTGLRALRDNERKTALEEQPSVDILRKDFVGIISLIYTYSTRLWIALGKRPPTHSAAFPTLDELSNYTKTLYGCALAFTDSYGGTLRVEIHTAAIEVLSALEALLRDYSESNGENSKQMTATLHEICDRSRNVSTDNREAVLKIWKQDSEALKDAIKELDELLNPDDLEDSSDGVSDGWDELLGGEETGAELSGGEMATVKKVLVTLEKTSALRKDIRKHVLLRAREDVNLIRDNVVPISQEMVTIVDDIVACCNPPLELIELRRLLARLSSSLRNLAQTCGGSVTTISESLTTLKVTDYTPDHAQTPTIASQMTKVEEIARAIGDI